MEPLSFVTGIDVNSAAVDDEFLLSQSDVGSDRWWQQLAHYGTPLVTRQDGNLCVVDFFWRDPQGSQHDSLTAQVVLEVNSITDHHSWTPVSLSRVADSDVWHHQMTLDARWHGSYCFIPLSAEQTPCVARAQSDGHSSAQREWYCSVMHQACSDSYNPYPSVLAGRGMQASMLHMPDAQQQSAWQNWDRGLLVDLPSNRVHALQWQSDSLGNCRSIWCFETVSPNDESTHQDQKPIVILLDGERWCSSSGAPSVLQELTTQQSLAPAIYIAIDAIDGDTRWRELSCYAPFWRAVFDELFPLLERHVDLPNTTNNVLVAGQSLGGLCALYAGLYWPTKVNRVVSLSGSFWWPDVQRDQRPVAGMIAGTPPGSLAEVVQSGARSVDHLNIFQSVGLHEGDMNFYNQLMADALTQAGGQVCYQTFHGGHDWVAWRTSLVHGLQALLPSKTATL